MQVRKSNGSIEEFDNQKIKDSICNAYEAVGEECDDLILQGITNSLYVYDNISTLEIRRQVEDALMSINKKVARAFSEKYSDMKDILKKQDFIKEYIAASNAATGSKFDANANVTSKNIVTMGQELYKENNIKQNRYILTDKIRKMYSKKLANQYIKDLESHVLYKHDETGTPGYPYTYSAMETVEVKYNGEHLMVPFTVLWDILKEEEVLVNYEDDVWQKYPKDLYVKDKGNTFIRVTVMTKKHRKRSLVWVKTSVGEDVVVTDNHPMIVNPDDINDTVEAINSQGQKQFKINEKLEFGQQSVIDMMKCPYVTEREEKYCMTTAGSAVKRYIDLDEEMGYLVGCIFGNKDVNVCWREGWFTISSADRRQLYKLNGILFEKTGIVGKIEICRHNLSNYELKVCDDAVWWLFRKEFGLDIGFPCRVLPYKFLEYREEFAKGMLDGLMDTIARADGDSILLKHQSRPLILQTTAILRHFGFGVENEYTTVPDSYASLETYWGVRCYGKDSSSYKKNGETTIEIVRAFGEGDDFMCNNSFIYDITTESRTFDLNNILVHNCVAITMYPFLVDGLTKLGGASSAPTDLKSYCGEFINLVYSVSSQFMGACMHKEQEIKIVEGIEPRIYTAKSFVEKYLGDAPLIFDNYQGEWEYAKVPEGIEVLEDGRTVKIKKVYRRKYDGDIYEIRTKDGYVAKVSKDHIFKQLYKARTFETKASDLQVGDTVLMNKDYSCLIDFNSKDFKKGWIIGMLCGDGCLTKENEVELSVNYDQEYFGEIFNEYCNEIYGYTLNKHNSHKCFCYQKYNKEFKDLVIEDIHGENAYDKTIDIDGKSLNYIAGFLDGIFCSDGSYTESHGVSITLTNEELAKKIQEAVCVFGIKTNIKPIPPRENRKESYCQYISSRILKYLKHVHEKVRDMGTMNKHDSAREIYYYGHNALGRASSNKRNLWSNTKCNYVCKSDVIESITIMPNDDKYVYEIETESHWYNCGGFITHNCATPEFLMYMDYFIRKDYGDNYLERLNEVVEATSKKRTLTQVIDNCFQQVVHSMNMPAGNRGYQSVFWNVSYYDREYFNGVFGDFVFSDGTKPKWETLSWLQKHFMKWFNKEREKYVLTFPVETMAMLTDGKDDFLDKEYADFTAEMWAEGHSFFCYLSDSPDSLSSCCFGKDQKTLTKSSNGVNFMTFKELYESKYGDTKKNFTIFHNGSWVKGKLIKLDKREMYRIVTVNNKEIIVSDNHLNPTFDGDKVTSSLTTNDYLLFNTNKLDTFPERDEGLTYEQGFVIGAFLGDGSFDSEINGKIYGVNFSQNVEKYSRTMDMVSEANKQLGGECVCNLRSVYNNVYPLAISSSKMAAFIMRWTNWTRGTYAWNKELNLDVLLQSYEFRKGILDGWYATDGGNSNRCYTSSPKLAENMEVLITSLGLNSIVDVEDRTDEKVIIRGEEYDRNYPLYCVRWYEPKNKRSMGNIFKIKNNSMYFKIKSIEKIEYDDDSIYCFEMANQDEPYFTLPNGIITHNCRLRNSLKDLDNADEEHNHTTHQYSMGTASVATGSKSVMTMNLPRLVQNAARKYFLEQKGIELEPGKNLVEMDLDKDYDKETLYKYIADEVREMTEKIHKYQTAFNEAMKDFLEAKMLDVYKAGFIDMRKQYLTVGVNGITDAAEFFGIKISPNGEYQEFVENILDTINVSNRKDRTRECMFNCEFVPAENLAAKNYKWDKKDGYWVNPDRVLYSSYFYNPEDTNLSVLDKFKLHGRSYTERLDGGSALHMNLQEHLSKEQYRQLLKVAALEGCNYFTFNIRNTVCNDCRYISKHTLDVCPRCGSKNLDWLTRVIGYLKRISSFSKPRQDEADDRYYA